MRRNDCHRTRFIFWQGLKGLVPISLGSACHLPAKNHGLQPFLGRPPFTGLLLETFTSFYLKMNALLPPSGRVQN